MLAATVLWPSSLVREQLTGFWVGVASTFVVPFLVLPAINVLRRWETGAAARAVEKEVKPAMAQAEKEYCQAEVALKKEIDKLSAFRDRCAAQEPL